MLVFVNLIFLLGFTHAQHRFNFNVVVYTINVGIGMVNDVVFVVPHDTAGSQCIYRESCNFIPKFTLTKTTVSAIMHNVKANSSSKPTH